MITGDAERKCVCGHARERHAANIGVCMAHPCACCGFRAAGEGTGHVEGAKVGPTPQQPTPVDSGVSDAMTALAFRSMSDEARTEVETVCKALLAARVEIAQLEAACVGYHAALHRKEEKLERAEAERSEEAFAGALADCVKESVIADLQKAQSQLQMLNENQSSEIATLRASLGKAEADARRYEWLLKGDPYVFVFNPEAGRIEGEDLDAVVDGGIRGA